MNKTIIKRVLSVLIIAIVIFGCVVSVKGIGPVQNAKDELKYGLDINGGVYVVMEADTSGIPSGDVRQVMEQTKEVLNRRVNALGVSEASVSIEGENRLRIEMPGVEDATEAIGRIGQTAQLRFTLADGTEYLTGEDIKTASADTDSQHGGYKIVLEFTGEGQKKFAEATEIAASGKTTPTVQLGENSFVDPTSIVIWLDDEILTAPTCKQKIDSTSCEISSPGGMPKDEALGEAALIRGGALPVSLKEISSSVQTASIGADALNDSIKAGGIGLILVFLLMILVFGVLGVFADIALTLYLILVVWIMIAMDAVLTLPGIAGIILGVGMAVDANVIIFTRIREEITKGRSIRSAVEEGYKNARVTVFDSQITTLIATVILYELGSTAVKGFALTLMISLLMSILTAVFVTQLFVDVFAETKFANNKTFGLKEDGTKRTFIKKNFNFIKNRKKFYVISLIVIIVGLGCLGFRGLNYGIDFTGGTMIEMDMSQRVDIDEVQDTIKDFGLNATIVYAGDDQTGIILKTTKALDAAERAEVTKAITDKYELKDSAVLSSEQFGATVGKEIKANAVKSILLAAIGMLLYIILRFKGWKYGASAVLALAHDILILISMYAIFGITVNNPFIAAVLTVVGYSINDTIVVFDRVRYNSKYFRKKNNLEEVLDKSINETVGRSIMTSVTTLAAIIPLIIMVPTLTQFALPLMVGIIAGTYSSIFLASPFFYEMEEKKK